MHEDAREPACAIAGSDENPGNLSAFYLSSRTSSIFCGLFYILTCLWPSSQCRYPPSPSEGNAHVLEHPLRMVKRLWKKRRHGNSPPPWRRTPRRQRVHTCATTFMEHAGFRGGKRMYELWQKEMSFVRVRKEIDALNLSFPCWLSRQPLAKLSTYSVAALSASRRQASRCSMCRLRSCHLCCTWWCSPSFCETCHDRHGQPNSCVKKTGSDDPPFAYSSMPTRQAR